MIAAVVPAKNESSGIGSVLNMLSLLPVDLVIPVINGCDDNSLEKALENSRVITNILYSKQPLGPDVPRAIGAKAAYDKMADYVLFVDGDMQSPATLDALKHLLSAATSARLDMALSDCYPGSHPNNSLAELVLYFRGKLNVKIGMPWLGSASPSHGPHLLSRSFLEAVSFRELAVPPVSLALAAKITGLNIAIGAKIPHRSLGSPYRSRSHARDMAKTIIGDCIEAMNVFDGKDRHRVLGRREYLGFHLQRNWQLLDMFLQKTTDSSQIIVEKLL
ncbi:glycosyltransferase family 2 protein [Phosphitispora sp. TUW77]|uniref:glycosyltransferase family 2 protein n=1 Tax=Phosphitispora sp. TUW77 TaxID=3152361 RepID=UPI003AB376F3